MTVGRTGGMVRAAAVTGSAGLAGFAIGGPIGGAVGVPLGAYLVTYLNPAYLRIGVGVLLILYSAYNLARPTIAPVKSNPATDTGSGRHEGASHG